jgi:hypothetical protein
MNADRARPDAQAASLKVSRRTPGLPIAPTRELP